VEAVVAVEAAVAVAQAQLKIPKIKTKINRKLLLKIKRMVKLKKLRQNQKKFHTIKKKKKNKPSMLRKLPN
jgi:hypothetical protein